MIALDKAAEEKAWRPLQDTGAAEFLAECVFAFDECFAVARGGQTLIASKRPVFVLSMSARKLDAVMCDGFRDGFPGNSAFAYGPWKKALLRFGLEEFRALESVLACVRHDEPFWSVPEIKDRFDPEFLVDEIKKGSTILKPECYEAELTLFRDLAAAGLFDDPRSKELLEKISRAERDYRSFRYKERAPEFVALADHLNLTKIDRLRQFCLEARWPLKMSPLDLLIKRIKNSD